MPTPDEEIRAFLSGGDAGDRRRLDVATVFARSMLRELRSAVAEWEATASTLEQAHALRQRRQGSASPGGPPFSGGAAGRSRS
jgi:hypothetical protein